MVHSKQVLVLLCTRLLAASAATTCQPRPLSIPIQDVSIGDQGAKMRGIALGLGSNYQNISFSPGDQWNETYVYGSDGLCNGDKYPNFTYAACTTLRGGRYSAANSASESVGENRTVFNNMTADWIADVFHLSSNTSLDNFTFGIPTKYLDSRWNSQSQLGLGRNSSLLTSLKETGKISALAYSMFWGLVSGSEDEQTSGSLVLGGLDRSLIGTGKNYTGAHSNELNSACRSGLLVTINDMTLNFPNGTDATIMGSGAFAKAIKACISPGYAGLMRMPAAYWDQFMNLAGGSFPNGTESRSSGINYYTEQFEPDHVYNGDLTISLGDEFSVRVPNNQLVVPERYVDALTGHVVTNPNLVDLVVNPSQSDTEELAVLGRSFLSSAYLSVNFDSNTFSLWQADTKATMGKISALDVENKRSEVFCGEDGSDTPSNGNGNPTQSSTKSGMSTGAKAGIGIGVVGIIALIAGAGIVLLRRRNSRDVKPKWEAEELNAGPPSPPLHSKPNMLAIPTELSTERYKHEAGGREVSRGEMELAELDGTNPRSLIAQP